MRVTLVVQARMGSTRFPGKVLAPLAGRPMLDHVLTRATHARCVHQLVVATTDQPVDDVVVSVAERRGARVVRGSEDDVLSRFVSAAELTDADVIVRVTADCPLLDPRLVDRVTRALVEQGADYASNLEPPTYPDGYDVEAVTVGSLRRISAMATQPYQREHVTAVARERPAEFTHVSVRCRRDLSALRLTVDVPDDLKWVEAVLLETGRDDANLGAVLAALSRRPDLTAPNGLPSRDEGYVAQRLTAKRAAENI